MLLLLLACTGEPAEPVVEPSPEPVAEPVAEPAPPPPPPAPAGPAIFQVAGKGVAVVDEAGARRVEGSPDAVDALAFAPDGALWLSAKGELRRAPSPGAPFEVVPASGGPGPLEDMAFAPDGALWAVSTDRLGVFQGGTWTLQELRPAQNFFAHVAVSPEGVVFVSDSQHVFEREAPEPAEGAWTDHDINAHVDGLHFTDELVFGPDGALYSLYAAADGGLLRYADGAWTTAPGFGKFDGKAQGIGFTAEGALITTNYSSELVVGAGGDAKEIEKRSAGYDAYKLHSFAADAQGRVWIGTDKGLVLLDAEREATQWSPGTVPALDGQIQRIFVLEGGPTPPGVEGAQTTVTGRLLQLGVPLANHDVALCSDASLMHRVHPCESAALSIEGQTDAEGRFEFEEVPFGRMDFIYKVQGEDKWAVVIGAGCCTGVRPDAPFDMGDVDLQGGE